MLSQLEMKRGEPGSGREVPARRRLEQEARVRGHTGLRNSTVPKDGWTDGSVDKNSCDKPAQGPKFRSQHPLRQAWPLGTSNPNPLAGRTEITGVCWLQSLRKGNFRFRSQRSTAESSGGGDPPSLLPSAPARARTHARTHAPRE